MYRLLAGLLFLGLLSGLGGHPRVPEVPVATDLRADGRLAAQRGLVILLEVAATDCGYCVRLEADFLGPMLVSGDYRDRVLFHKINVDDGSSLIGFDGERVDADAFAHGYGVRLTPTLLFLGPDGRELAPRMVGLTTPDFYGAYLDQSIDAARQALAELPKNRQ